VIGGLSILFGYLTLIWQAGWAGVAFIAIHIALMLFALGK
jgi:hypothetical protein